MEDIAMSGTVRRMGFGRAYLQSAGTSYVLFVVGVVCLWCPVAALALWAAAATDLLVEPLVFRGEQITDCPRCGRTTPLRHVAAGAFRCQHCGARIRAVAGRVYAF